MKKSEFDLDWFLKALMTGAISLLICIIAFTVISNIVSIVRFIAVLFVIIVPLLLVAGFVGIVIEVLTDKITAVEVRKEAINKHKENKQ